MSAALLDTRLDREAPEGIALSLSPAGLPARALAFAFDLMLRAIAWVALAVLVLPLGSFGAGLWLIVIFALEWLYPVVFELTRHGATPGKRLLGLRVVMDSGLPVTPAAALMRNLLRAVDFLPFCWALGVLSMLLRHDFKRLGDLAAGTLVVHVAKPRPRLVLPDVPARRSAQPLPPRAQAALVAWAARLASVTPARGAELAALVPPRAWPVDLAEPLAGPEADADRVAALASVAQWLSGRR